MIVNPYEERNKILLSIGTVLGFQTYKEYLETSVWKEVIRDAIMKHRDAYKCRSVACKGKGANGKQLAIHHLAYTRSVLLGINPSCLVTLCKGCHQWCEFDDKGTKLNFKEAQQRAFELIIGERKVPGRSSRKIGNWFRNAYQTNRPIAQRILYTYFLYDTPWYRQVIEDFQFARLPNCFASYLKLTPAHWKDKGIAYDPFPRRKQESYNVAWKRRQAAKNPQPPTVIDTRSNEELNSVILKVLTNDGTDLTGSTKFRKRYGV